MERVELFTIKDTFWLSGNGVQMLILAPDFSVPKGWEQRGWNERRESIIIVRPDGQEIEATAQINMTHYNIRDPKAPLDKRWRITISLMDRTKDEVPVGSKILVSQQVRDALFPPNTV